MGVHAWQFICTCMHIEIYYASSEEVGHVSSVYDIKLQLSIVLLVEACLAVSKVVHCIEKVCKGSGMFCYGYTIGFLNY